MMIKFYFCRECSEILQNQGMPAYNLYLEICNYYFTHDKPIEFTYDDPKFDPYRPILVFLELKNYIVSTESAPDLVQIKPLHIQCVREETEDQGIKFDKVCQICMGGHSHAI